LLPPDFDPRAATMIITWRETLSFALRMGVHEGASVLVLGSGGNGLSFIRMAKVLGARRVTAVGSASRKANAERAGADAYRDYRVADWDKNLGEGGGFDYIIDAAAGEDGLRRSLRYLKAGGICGIYALETDPAKPVLIAPTASKGFTFFPAAYDEEETNDRVIELVEAGALDAGIWLDYGNIFELRDILEAFDSIENKRFVKALVKL
jgi:threonine dehydrogenase-like Zn-dependent dehydrogenase